MKPSDLFDSKLAKETDEETFSNVKRIFDKFGQQGADNMIATVIKTLKDLDVISNNKLMIVAAALTKYGYNQIRSQLIEETKNEVK